MNFKFLSLYLILPLAICFLFVSEQKNSYFSCTRYYDPKASRFISADPITPTSKVPSHSLNRYAYAFNNPCKYDDPDGHAPRDPSIDTSGTATEKTNIVDFTFQGFGKALGKIFGNDNSVARGFQDFKLFPGDPVITGFRLSPISGLSEKPISDSEMNEFMAQVQKTIGPQARLMLGKDLSPHLNGVEPLDRSSHKNNLVYQETVFGSSGNIPNFSNQGWNLLKEAFDLTIDPASQAIAKSVDIDLNSYKDSFWKDPWLTGRNPQGFVDKTYGGNIASKGTSGFYFGKTQLKVTAPRHIIMLHEIMHARMSLMGDSPDHHNTYLQDLIGRVDPIHEQENIFRQAWNENNPTQLGLRALNRNLETRPFWEAARAMRSFVGKIME